MSKDLYKEKFRAADRKLDDEVDAALGDLSLENLYGFDKPQPAPSADAKASKGPKRGKIISIDAKQDEVFVDFGGKSQGVAVLSELELEPKIGDEIEFNVERYDPAEGLLILTRKGSAASNVSWDNLEIGAIVEGVVTGSNKGGLELQVKTMRAFMPAGQVDLYYNADLTTFIGQKLRCEVTQFEAHAKNLVVSRRNLLEREKEDAKQKMLLEIEVGQIRRGVVRSVMDYGAFVDLGGLDGLLHVSEMTYRRGTKASDLIKVGDVVDVKITRFDKETSKLSLSLKQTMTDPWAAAAERYPVGTSVTGRVSKVESFGAFIEVEEGLEGLLPVSEISYQRIKSPSDLVKEGDTLRLVVISIDPTARKISFSLKQAGVDPWKTAAESYPADTNVSGTVTRTVDFGAFVEIETGLEGLIHISELADHRVKRAEDVVKVGQTVQVRVLEVDPKGRRISLSLKRAAETAAAVAPSTPAAPAKPRKKQTLKGGLDWNW